MPPRPPQPEHHVASQVSWIGVVSLLESSKCEMLLFVMCGLLSQSCQWTCVVVLSFGVLAAGLFALLESALI